MNRRLGWTRYARFRLRWLLIAVLGMGVAVGWYVRSARVLRLPPPEILGKMSKEQLGDLESAFAKQVADLQEKETQAWDKRIRLEREWMAKISKGLGIQVVATRASVRFAATDLNDRLATQALVAYEREKALDGELRDTIRDLTVVRQTIVDRIAAQANANLVSQDDATDGNATDDELAQLRGDWLTEFMLSDGAPIAIKLPLGDTLNKYHPLLHASFRGSDWVDIGQDGKGTRAFCSINLDASVNPKKIDLVRANGVIRGIYRCEANTLWLCLNADQTSNRRPDEFTSGAGDSRILMRCERSTAKHVQSAVTPLSDTDRKGSGCPCKRWTTWCLSCSTRIKWLP